MVTESMAWVLSTGGSPSYAAVQSQKAVTAYLKSKQLLPLGFARQYSRTVSHSDQASYANAHRPVSWYYRNILLVFSLWFIFIHHCKVYLNVVILFYEHKSNSCNNNRNVQSHAGTLYGHVIE